MENEETIVADEQTDVDVQEETTETETYEEDVDVEALKAQLAKEKADKEKWEARYKSTKKQETKAKQVESKVDANVDLNSLVEQKIAEISERKAFKEAHGEEIFNDVLKIKEKHPTLSLEEALKFSPIANDPARTANSEQYSSPGRANISEGKIKTMTFEKFSKLPQSEYNIISDKVKSWEIKLID